MTRRPEVRRPSPEDVAAVARTLSLSLGQRVIPPADVITALQRETRCSRATAYRALNDALNAGRLRRV